MEVKILKGTVKIKDELTWGDSQKIQNAILSGTKMSGKATNANDVGLDFDASVMLKAKYVALECAIIEIEEDGQKKQFSEDWMNSLSLSDGEKVMEAVDKLQKKDKGTPSN